MNIHPFTTPPDERYCTRCVMGSRDSDIVFDSDGICNYCKALLVRLEKETYYKSGSEKLNQLVSNIKKAGEGKEYDCVIGLSGGVDSSYVAYLVKKHGLRPLAIHLDNGWNSELAVQNIQEILSRLNIDLYTHVIDWNEFKDLQLSFIRANVPNIEIATDHAINAILQQMACKFGVRYILTGSNIRGEGIYPKAWGWNYLDLKHIKAIHKQYGSVKLTSYPTLSLFQFFVNVAVRKIRTIPILNYVEYSKSEAKKVLEAELGWRPYGGKHFESIWTRFYQGYIMTRKFGVDKRQAHFSSLVMVGDMNRSDALDELEVDPYEGNDLASDVEYVVKKFDLTEDEFERIMTSEAVPHRHYPNDGWLLVGMPKIKALAKKLATRG